MKYTFSDQAVYLSCFILGRYRGGGTVFGLGKQTVNGFLENENFGPILFSEFQNFGEAFASPASPVPPPLGRYIT